jgi:hypothetical protein
MVRSGRTAEAQDTTNTGTDTQRYNYDYQENLTAAWTPSSGSCTAAPSSSSLGGPAPYWHSYTYDPATDNRLSETVHATDSTGSTETDTYTYPAAGAGEQSPDEYPFASTYEGGSGAQVLGVPLAEQRIQGGSLSRFYQQNNIGDGDQFLVRVSGGSQ